MDSRASHRRARGQPAAYFIFTAIAWLAALAYKMMLARNVRHARRISRTCGAFLALFLAAGSFFLGQPQVFPASVRDSGLLPIPVLLIFVLMFFWLLRVRFSQRYRRA